MSDQTDDSTRTVVDWAWPAQLFRVGDLVARRYRIERFVGQGAMGEVYAARDLELGQAVALKVLRVGANGSPDSIERFKREILLARRISHPNVCRIFDLGLHTVTTAPERESKPVLFLTMELVEGRTLVERLAADGPFDEEEARPVVRQLAEALAAAHAAGVVHRDFKSSNILLVESRGGVRAVVTDFGLASDQSLAPDSPRLTATGGVLGTPAYMAPEQVEGLPADPRSDLYSFGVVLYEMLTGHLPFEGETPLAIAIQRVRRDPIPAESRRPKLSQRALSVVARGLERDPARRFADPLALADAFEGVSLAGSPPPRGRRRLAAVVAAGVVGLTVLIGLRIAGDRAGEPPVVEVPVAARDAIVVLPLRNATGRPENAWLQTALAEMLTTELAANGGLRAVPGEVVARSARDLSLVAGEALAPATLIRLRRSAGADLALVGSFVGLGDAGAQRLRLDLRLQRTDGATGPAPRRVEGDEADLFALVERAGDELRSALGLPPPATRESGARAALAMRGAAFRLYTDGLERLRAGEPLEARARFEASLAEDGEAPLAWAALSETWSQLGWPERAAAAAGEAFERRTDLPRAEALLVEGRHRFAAGDRDAAVEIHRALWLLYPDDPEHGLRLASSLVEAEGGEEALAVVERLRALPAPASDDPRIDLIEAGAAGGLSRFRRQLEAAQRAEARAAAAGSPTLAARALYEQGLAARRLGQTQQSRDALSRARRLAAEAGDRGGVARALLSLAHVVRAGGDLDEAGALYAEARATFATLGNRRLEARAELAQGLVISQQGDLAGGIGLYRSALAKLREVGDRRGAASALSNIGSLLYEQGDLNGAAERHLEALAVFRELGDESRMVVSLQNLAQIRQDRGELAAAAGLLEEELALARAIEDRTGEGYALKGLADLLLERGEYDRAEERYAEAAALFERTDQKTWRLYTEMGRAALDLERGRTAAAGEVLDRLVQEFARAGMEEDRDEAALHRLRTLIAAARIEEAEALAGQLLPRAQASEVRRLRHLARIAAAELDRARGRTDSARALLTAEEQRCRAEGLVLFELEARAELARLELEIGSAGAAERAAAIRGEAERIGAGRIAARLTPARN